MERCASGEPHSVCECSCNVLLAPSFCTPLPDIPSRVEVHYLVENVISAVQTLETNGCRKLVDPFDIAIGKCAVIEDPFGTRLCILDMTKGPLKPGPQLRV